MDEIVGTREHWAALLRRIIKYTRGRADAEDLLHTAYLRLEHYRAEHTVENPVAFLVTTTANLAIDQHRHDRVFMSQPLNSDTLTSEDPSPLQDEVIEARERLKRVRQGLEKLSPRTREVFLMHRIDGLKQREIAARLGISQSAVEKHIAKAMLFLTEWTEGW